MRAFESPTGYHFFFWDGMQLQKRKRRRSGNKAPLLVAALIILAAIVFFGRSALFADQSGGGSGASPAATASLQDSASAQVPNTASATATAAPSPTPTVTPIPGPKKITTAPFPFVSAASAVAIDHESGAIIYDKDAHVRRAPASITKIVTSIVAIERGKPSDIVTVRYNASELYDSTLMGVNPNDKVSLEDLLYGLMLPSGNEAALAIANHVSGSKQAFVDQMNNKMKDLGLVNSHFVNPHGLDESGHYSSAYDMAMISRYGWRYPLFRQLSAAKSHPVSVQRATTGQRDSYDVYNLNKLLWNYAGVDGVKIGYTENAGRTIVATATKDGHRVFVALLGSGDLWTDTPRVLDYVFDNFTW